MKPLYLPLVKGIQDADADSSEAQTGKLADACNVHVHPERANALSLRPTFSGKWQLDPNARVCVAGGRPAFVGEDDFGRLQDDNTYFSETSDSQRFRNYAVVSTSEYVTRQLGDVLTVAYAEQANGDNVAMVAVETNTASFAVYYQRVANGRKYAEQLWTSVGSNQPRMYIFPRTGGAGFLSVVNDAFSGAITMRLSTTNNDTFGSSITLVGTVLLDMVQNTNGTYSYIYTLAGAISFRRVDETGATVEGPYAVSAKTNAAYAGIVRISDTNWHVWHGGYPVDANDTLYVSNISGASALLNSWVNATTPAPIGRVISVGGGSIKVDALNNGTGSYCYLAGGNGDDPRVGRLFAVTSGMTTFYSQYCAPILPMGRLWCDTSFFGVRIWGLQQKIGGCWELTPGTETTTNINVRCRPIAYHTVTRALPPSTGVQALRQFSIYQTTDRSKALLFGRDSSSITLVEIGYDQPTRGLTVNNSSFDVLIGGVPRYWDGVTFVPVGIPQAPVISSASPSGGGALAAGTYVYTMVWEWVDAAGNRQQSPAQLETVTVPATGQVSLEIHPGSIPYDERIAGLRPGMRGVVYRTDPGGTILKRGELYLDFSLTTVGPPSGLWAADYFIVQDNGTIDFSLGEPLYMSPGGANELAATAMEETFLMRPYSDRIIGVSLSFPDQLWYTKTIQVGRGIEPNQALYFRLPEVATGLAVQDGNVYWFSASNCWAFVPQFADDTGLGGGAVDPVPLATGVGCEATNSIVETPVGVFFIGPRGPWVIPRGGGAPTFVGVDVEEFFRLFPVCRGAVYNAAFSEVVFAMEATSGQQHCLIIYNHLVQQWFRWMIGDDALATFGTACVKALSGGIVYADGMLAVGGVDGGTLSILHLDDVSPYDNFQVSSDRKVHPYLETKNYYPSGGPAELFRANRFALDCVYGGDMTFSSSANDGSTWAAGYVILVGNSDQPPIYRFPVQKVRGVRWRLYTTWNGFPVAFQDDAASVYNGVTLYTAPLGRAKSGAASYRG
jgi:hypothetical protein